MINKKSAIVVGAGIVGLATARALALKGFNVTVIERNEKAVGASIRNFGMLWPIGQPDGGLYERALRSKAIWLDIADSIDLWYDPVGSLHVAHNQNEWEVLQELQAAFLKSGRPVKLLTNNDIKISFNGVNQIGLKGGLFSATETIVDARTAIEKIPAYLQEYLNVNFIWGRAVNHISGNKVYLGNEIIEADIICVCSGADFEILYPFAFKNTQITKCKLQMLRYSSADPNFKMGVSLCGGLSLIHYNSFKVAPSLQMLREQYEQDMSEYLQWGIHVMVAQNHLLELTVGDSHEYGLTFDPFDKEFINKLIIDYLRKFAVIDNWHLTQTWHGIYPKMTNNTTELFLEVEPNVFILNGIGGAGMTLSFGFAEECINKL